MKKMIAGIVAGCALAFAGQALAQEKLTVWWVKGFYKSEDDALYEAIKKYEAKSGVKVELSQYPIQDMIPKTVAALDAGSPPDVAYADVYDFQVAGKWAFDDKLEDLTSVLDPIKGRFLKNTLETTYLYDDKAKKRAYYAFPLKQQTTGRSGATRCSPRSGRRPDSASSGSASRWASTRVTRSIRS